MKRIFLFLATAVMLTVISCADNLETVKEKGDESPVLRPVEGDDSAVEKCVFELLSLEQPGLSKVKTAYENGNYYAAAVALRNYWRGRSDIFNPNVDLIGATMLSSQMRIADQAKEHRFYINQNYFENKEGNTYTYFLFEKDGEIDWNFIPQKYASDQEFRYQIHRHNWVPLLGKAYWVTRDDSYAKSFRETYLSWSKAFPVPVGVVFPVGDNNTDYQWKGLQPATRIINYLDALPYVIQSDEITPEFLCLFLYEFAETVECVRKNYYQDTNILISQSKAVTLAGLLMPEFVAAENWLNEGANKLSNEMDKQFFKDGVHYEFDPSYHISAIADFLTVFDFAKANGKQSTLGENYIDKLEKAAEFVVDITFPDYSIDNFNDTRASSYTRSILIKNFKRYAQVFPQNQKFRWMATEGVQGEKPDYNSKAYPEGGYYILRNGWDNKSTMLIHKNNNNIDQKWHCQPDNGTFALWSHGRNYLPDAGCFAYNGANRTKYRASNLHNTVTVGNKTFADFFCESEFVSFDQGKDIKSGISYERVVTRHEIRDRVKHERSIYFVDNKFYVILDAVSGKISGETIELSYHLLADGNAGNTVSALDGMSNAWQVKTNFEDNNLCLTLLSSENATITDKINSSYSSSLNVETGKREGFRIVADASTHSEATSTSYFVSVLLPAFKSVEKCLPALDAANRNLTLELNYSTIDTPPLHYGIELAY